MGKQSHMEQVVEKITLGHTCKNCLIGSSYEAHTESGVKAGWIIDVCRRFPRKEYFNCVDCPRAQDFYYGGFKKREKKLLL